MMCKNLEEIKNKFVQYSFKLMDSIKKGRSESSEADELRDELDYLYRQIPEEEIEYLTYISGDLYQTHQKPMYIALSDNERVEKTKELIAAIKEKDWRKVLILLRDGLRLEDHEIAMLRAQAYAEFPEISAEFLSYAVEAYARYLEKKG